MLVRLYTTIFLEKPICQNSKLLRGDNQLCSLSSLFLGVAACWVMPVRLYTADTNTEMAISQMVNMS